MSRTRSSLRPRSFTWTQAAKTHKTAMPQPRRSPKLPTLRVGRQTAGFLQRGHPWVRQDRFLGSFGHLRTGAAITLIDEKNRPLGSALADPQAHDGIVARVYDTRPDRPFQPHMALQRAAQLRQRLQKDPATDCYRLVHGEADFLPGIRIECYGACCVVLLRSAAAVAHQDAIVAALQEVLGHNDIIIRRQVSDLRRSQVATTHASGRPCDPSRVVQAHELGQRYDISPENDLATGIYVDQRATRIWLQQQIAKRNQHSQRNRVINLFAYTGIFSCAALAAGAEHAIDIDLSGPALATAAKNAANNGHTAHHDIIQGDCLQALNELPAQSCDILICDPPTAAGGKNTSKGPSAQAAKTNAMTNKQGTSKDTGHKGWVVRRDYPTLLQACERVLAPGGLLITCCNTLGRKAFDLPAAVADIGLEVAAPELGSDLPQKRGFPEGRPFQIVVRKK